MSRVKKLFECLVVRDQMKNQMRALIADLRNTFEKKRHLFEERRKTFTSKDEGAHQVVEEQQDIQSTVMDELKWIAGLWIKSIDVTRQVEEGNTLARADVTLEDETVLLSSVPATALLELANRADEIQQLIMTVPTLDPAKAFTEDLQRGNGIYKARDISRRRTKKHEDHKVVVPPTKEHPAVVVKVVEDMEIGTVIEQEWSGMITPARKSEMLARAEEVRRAIKQALHRANATDLTAEPVAGAAIFSYVLGVSVGADSQAGARSQQ